MYLSFPKYLIGLGLFLNCKIFKKTHNTKTLGRECVYLVSSDEELSSLSDWLPSEPPVLFLSFGCRGPYNTVFIGQYRNSCGVYLQQHQQTLIVGAPAILLCYSY